MREDDPSDQLLDGKIGASIRISTSVDEGEALTMRGSRFTIRRPKLLVGALACFIIGAILFGTWVNQAVACAQEKTRILAQAFPKVETGGQVQHCRRTQVVADQETKKGEVTFSISVKSSKESDAKDLTITPSGSGKERVYAVPKGAVTTVKWKPSDSLADVYEVKRSDTGLIYSSSEATNKDEVTDPHPISFTELDQSVTYTATKVVAGEPKDELDSIKIIADEGAFHVVFDAHGKDNNGKEIPHNDAYRYDQPKHIASFRIPDPSQSVTIKWTPVGLDRKPFAIVLDDADQTVVPQTDKEGTYDLPDKQYIKVLNSKELSGATTITYKAYVYDDKKKEIDKSKELGQLDILLGAAKGEIDAFTVNGAAFKPAPIHQYSDNMLLKWEMSAPTDDSEFDLTITDGFEASTKAVIKPDISPDDKTFSVITSFRDLVKTHLGVDGKPRKPLPGTYRFTISVADDSSTKTVEDVIVTADSFSFSTQVVAEGWCTPQDDNTAWCPRQPNQPVGVSGAGNVDWYIQSEGQGVVRFGHGMNGVHAELYDADGVVCSATTQPVARRFDYLPAFIFPIGQDGIATFKNTDQDCLGMINPEDTYRIRFTFVNGEQYRYFIYDEGGLPINEGNPNGLIGPNGAVNGVVVGPFSKINDGDFESFELAKRPTILGTVSQVNGKRANPPFGLCLRYAEGRVFNNGKNCDFYRPANANQTYLSYHFYLDSAYVGVAQGNVRLTPGPGESRTFAPNPFYINVTPEHPFRYIPLFIH